MSSFHRWGLRACTALGAAIFSVNTWAAGPTLLVATSASPALQGSSLTLSVRVEELLDLFAFQYSLSFNPSVLQVVSVSEGSFLSAGGTTFYGAGTVDNTGGSISSTFNSLLGAVSGVNGNGLLATVVFNVTGLGVSNFGFSDVDFLNSNFTALPLQVQGGSVQAVLVPEPSVYLLFGAGLAGLAFARRRRLV